MSSLPSILPSDTTVPSPLTIGTNLLLSASGLTAQRTFTFPDLTDTLVGLTATQTLTNKTLSNPTLTNLTLSSPLKIGNLSLSATGLTSTRTFTFPDATDTVATLGATQTLTSTTLASPTLSGTLTGTYTVGGTPTLGSNLALSGDNTISIASATNRLATISSIQFNVFGTSADANAAIQLTSNVNGGGVKFGPGGGTALQAFLRYDNTNQIGLRNAADNADYGLRVSFILVSSATGILLDPNGQSTIAPSATGRSSSLIAFQGATGSAFVTVAAIASGTTPTWQFLNIPAFVAGDKYLVVDASGNVHKSAVGPAS